MSDAHDHRAPARPETTHPLLWTAGMLFIVVLLAWWFATWMHAGRIEGRLHGPVPLPQAAAGEPDHLALIARHDQAVLDEGATLFTKNCAACHGANGDGNPAGMNPPPRNLRKDAWKNPKGGGPYGLYSVLTTGYGGSMPAFPALTPEQRYAIVHHMRETMVKTDNQANWVAADPEAVAKQIPPPGTGDAGTTPVAEETAVEGPRPDRIVLTTPVQPLMAGTARDAGITITRLRDWLAEARRQAPPQLTDGVTRLSSLVDSAPGLVAALRGAVRDDQQEVFIRLLAGSDGSGALRPTFSLSTNERLSELFAHLRRLEKPQ